MTDKPRPNDDIPVADAVPARRAPKCPCCGSEGFEWLGRHPGKVEYVPRESDGAWIGLIRHFSAKMRVCIDCGFIGYFADRALRDKLADKADG